MKISILCSRKKHPIYPFLELWHQKHSISHDVQLINEKKSLVGGDILFLISCNEIVGKDVTSKFRKSLVIHASDVPKGRGWSPHIWQVLEGSNNITISMLEAEEKVDSGAIWRQKTLKLEGHELYDEINEKLFAVEFELMDYAVENFNTVKPRSQDDVAPTYYRKRTPEDSRIDPNKSISEQFELLRIADPNRFPAFFDLRGHSYKIVLLKQDGEKA